jgi:LmbE family N-acetylglucosaminyl deacetylase
VISLNQSGSEVYSPYSPITSSDLLKTTHLGIGAHPDDLEILAGHGIIAAYEHPGYYFTGVTVTNGQGAPRSGIYAEMSDRDFCELRWEEQKTAAKFGLYLAQFLLNYSSEAVKLSQSQHLISDLQAIISVTRPSTIYTHNLADLHDTHVVVAICVIEALRKCDPPLQDITLYGCEVWRGLDWLSSDIRCALDVSKYRELQRDLIKVFHSQIESGKRYDLAVEGRQAANATLNNPNRPDEATHITYAMNMTPLIYHPEIDLKDYIIELGTRKLESELRTRLNRLRGHFRSTLDE